MKDSKLLQNLSLGPYVLQNRIVLPPLTRSRSTQPGNIPNELMATYYQQRAGAGFMGSPKVRKSSHVVKAMLGLLVFTALNRLLDGVK